MAEASAQKAVTVTNNCKVKALCAFGIFCRLNVKVDCRMIEKMAFCV